VLKRAFCLAILSALSTTYSVSARPLEGVRDLQQSASLRAEDLTERPELWQWEHPRIAQKVPEDEGTLLDEVTVTATRRPVPVSETTTPSYVVTKEDFTALGATTVADALQLIPGFQTQPGGAANAGRSFLRGFDDSRFQIFRDGLPLPRAANNRNDPSRLQIEDIERIEVLSGGATLRYGQGAVGGVINLITETPKGLPKVSLRYDTGSYGFSRYTAKYSGGDDTFSYNLVFSSQVAFNNFPFAITVPNTAQFYGPTTNPNAQSPVPNSTSNSFALGQSTGAADPSNGSAIDLFGYLKPEVGPPLTIRGRTDAGGNASDSYSAKVSFKPNPDNRLILRFSANNNRFAGGAGVYALGVCRPGQSNLANPTLATERFLPVNPDSSELPCNFQRYLVRTPSTSLGFPYRLLTSGDGSLVFPPGQPYGIAENAIGTGDFYQVTTQSSNEVALLWDLTLTPATSINSYAYFNDFKGTSYVPTPFLTNTNLFPNGYDPSSVVQPAFNGKRFEIQSVLNTPLSPGQTLAIGLNYSQNGIFQFQNQGTSFVDQTISTTSLFITDDISFSRQWKGTAGLRYTYSTQYGQVLTPAFGVRFTPNPVISFRANWSQVFNAPSLRDLYISNGTTQANPNLRPETGITYDIGLDYIPSRDLNFQFTYFNTTLDGNIGTFSFRNPDLTNLAVPFLSRRENIDSRRASGIELVGTWRLNDQVNLRLSWTNTDARQFGGTDNVNSNFLFFYQYQEPFISFNAVSLSATYRNAGLTVGLVGRYDGGKRRGENLFGVGAYAALDLNIEIPISANCFFTANVANLTDTQYEAFAGVPAPGTTFRLGARLEFGGSEEPKGRPPRGS
jgi:iron complex outermembrane recepter protein